MSKEVPKLPPEPIPRENPFGALSRMVKSSVGRLPAHLVIIFFVSLTLTVICGVVLQLAVKGKTPDAPYLPLRLSPEADKPVLSEGALSGVWVHGSQGYTATLRIGAGVFEIILRHADAPLSRYFIRGGYKTEGNVLVLQARKDLGTPIDPEHFEYKFYPLEISNINLYADINGPIMVWKTPAREIERQINPEQAARILFSEDTMWAKIIARP